MSSKTTNAKKTNGRPFELPLKPLLALYAKPLPSTRSGSLYNAFSYPTKISPESIAVFIATHTQPGALVLDGFAGSGTTGLATLLCERPTDYMKSTAKALGVKPVWGPRRAVLYELSTVGALVSKTMCNPPNPTLFETAARKLLKLAEAKVGDVYRADDPQGKRGFIRHVIWTDVLICPQCRRESKFSDVAVAYKPLRFRETFLCPHCKKKATLSEIPRATEVVFDSYLKQKVTQRKRKPAFVYGNTNGKKWKRPATRKDEALARKIKNLKIPSTVPLKKLEWGDLWRSGYHTGVSYVHHFYTPRNLLVLATLWEEIDKCDPAVRDALRLLVLSYNASHSTLMTRVVAKHKQKDFVLTGAQSGVLYISSLPVEKNIFEGLRRKISTLKSAFSVVYGCKGHVQVFNTTSTKLHLPDRTVDYVFSDPPFGDYIPYSELNQLNEAWLGKVTQRADEIIVSSAQGKNVATYSRMMRSVFLELKRVLKDHGKATVVFHSAKAAVWRAVMDAYTDAGLAVRTASVLNKEQASFKQVVSNVSSKGDPLLLLTKKNGSPIVLNNNADANERIIKKILTRATRERDDSEERTAERLYSRYVSHCLETGVSVSMNADSFYSRVRGINGMR